MISRFSFNPSHAPENVQVARQLLISAGYGAVHPSLPQLVAAYVTVLWDQMPHDLSGIAEILGVNRQAVWRWMRQMGRYTPNPARRENSMKAVAAHRANVRARKEVSP